ncbi:hypothetical protein ZIOFF_025679 [Zingiber officinale]|uniref:Uncharacterized protein n=1 Tax=Zingiber officinale TaxID=94328 RepID=A0A8J5GUG9_ZINOF|nr:hypothetical protein ZIOFF_025679 [Zingiber officinale]
MSASLILFLYPIGRGQAPSSASISSTADANAHNRSFIPESAGHLISSTIFLAVDGKMLMGQKQILCITSKGHHITGLFYLGATYRSSTIIPRGATTTYYVTLHPNLMGVIGKYFDEELSRRLWDLSENMVKVNE